MEDWRTMAAALMGETITGNTMANAAFEAIDVAHSHFSRAAEVCGSFRRQVYYQRPAGDALPYLPTAMDHVRIAIISARRVSGVHAGSGHVFSLCGARIGLQGSAPSSWQRWQGHHAEAAAHAATALQRLHSAWSLGSAASDAVQVMILTAPMRLQPFPGIFFLGRHAAHELLDNDFQLNHENALTSEQIPPEVFPLWDAWAQAAEQLLRRATHELAIARAALQQMRRAIVAAYFDACWMLLCRAAS